MMGWVFVFDETGLQAPCERHNEPKGCVQPTKARPGALKKGGNERNLFSGLHNVQFSQLHCETDNMTEVKRRKGTEIGLRRGYNEESMNTGLFFMFISIHSWYVIVHRFYMG